MSTLLTTAETAALLNVSTRTVARRAALPPSDPRHLPYVRKLEGIRGGYLFKRAAIDLIAGRAA